MKKFVLEFIRRGLCASGLGPLVLAVVYLILEHQGLVHTLTVTQVCVGIFTLSGLAFVAGGMNVIYLVERLPLMAAIGIHGAVLYVSYLGTYLANNWLAWRAVSVLVFSGIFTVGYLLIWAVIYAIIKRRTDSLNRRLREKQRRQ